MKFTRPVFREIAVGDQQDRWQSSFDKRGVYFRPLGKHTWAFLPWSVLTACYGGEDIAMDQRPGSQDSAADSADEEEASSAE